MTHRELEFRTLEMWSIGKGDFYGLDKTLGVYIFWGLGYLVVVLIYYKLTEMGNTLYEIRDILKRGRLNG